MALSVPRKKKIIRIIIIIIALVDHFLDEENSGTPEEQTWRLLNRADYLMDGWDENEANWTADQNALAGLIDEIYNAHAPEAISNPATNDYEDWADDLADKIDRL